ncbi:MAG: HD domain-containing protein, partial [Planctomycetota bacterium]
LVHGSPASIVEYIEEGISDQRLGELAAMAGADIVSAGHSHRPFLARSVGTLFVNTGSVGRPNAGGGRSCYALLTVGASGVGVKHCKPRYDMKGALEAVGKAGLAPAFARMIRTGQKLKQALAVLASAASEPAPHSISPQTRRLAGAFGDIAHSRRVTRLTMSLFDQLAEPLGLGARDRLLLETAALLHDIGWRVGQPGHHKESMRMILASADLGLSAQDQLVVANIARYHRRALPSLRHAKYRQLAESDRRRVKTLGGLLRLADGLDFRHLGRVRQVKLAMTDRRLAVRCRTVGDAEEEKAAARNKSDLLEVALGRSVDLDGSWPCD